MKSQLHRIQTGLSGLALAAMCVVLIAQARAATALPPADASPPKTAEAIPWSQIGAKAGADYKGDGLAVTRTESGARLRCVFQKLEGDATSKGLWLTSTGSDVANDRFRVVASSVGRDFGVRRQSAAATPLSDVREMIKPEEVNVRSKSGAALRFPPQSKTMPVAGYVSIDGQTVRFTRPGLVEEYTVSMDGVRQDFIIEQPPLNTLEEETFNVQRPTSNIEPRRGELRVELSVTGAKVEQAADGARLVLENSGRKIAYNRLRVTDATGRELSARMQVADKPEIRNPKSEISLAVLVNDTDAVYPVRIDPTFSDENWISMGGIPGANYQIYAAVADAAGNLYIGGAFTIVGNAMANYVAKWNGSSWTALGSGMNGFVYALAVSGNDVYAGGEFTTAGGSAASNVAKWNGSGWSALGSGLNRYVAELAVSGSNLYAGGFFTTAGGSDANYVAKWNGQNWSALGLGMNQPVQALAVSGDDLYAGGEFTSAGGSTANYVAKWNGSNWSALGSGMNGSVYALTVFGRFLYAGGTFTLASGGFAPFVAKWDGNQWTPLVSGPDSTVTALAVLGNNLYAGGNFLFIRGGLRVNGIAKWDGSSWSGLGSGFGSLGGVLVLAASGSNLYAGGIFGAAGGVSAKNVAKWNGSSWMKVAPEPIGMNDGVLALAVMGSNVFAGGYFTSAGGGTANYVARWNGSNWAALGAGMNKRVTSLEVLGTNVYAGGEFTMAGGSAANYVARWNGSNWSALGSGMNGVVSSLVVLDGNLYAGGAFTTAGGIPANRIAKWNGSNWSALGSGMNGYVSSLAVSGSNLYAGGSFTSVGGHTDTSIARWDGINWSPVGSRMYGYTLSALAASDNSLYMADYNVTVIDMEFGKVRIDGRISKWDGREWLTIGYETNGSTTLAVNGNDLYAGVSLTTANGTPANGIAKWNPATGWSALGSGIGGSLAKIVVSGSNLFVGGWFQTAGGKVSPYIAKAVIGGNVPDVTLQPASRTNGAGTIASFSVSAASGSAFGYQWIKNGSPLSDGGKVSGATTATLTLTNVLHADRGSYAAIVTNTWGSVTSAVATLTVIDPVITAQPQDQFVTAGDNATFTVEAIGTPPLDFHWLKDGAFFQTSTAFTLTLSNVQKSHEGFYSAVVSNLFGVATSESASLRVNLPPVADASATRLIHVSLNGVNATVILDGSRSFDPDGDLLQYAWYESGITGQLASGAVAITALPAGTHPLLLVVSDPMASRTNGVTVAVLTTAQAVERLLALVNANVSHPKSLRATLNAAMASIARGNSVSAINQLQAFQNQVRAQVAPLNPGLAATLTQAAQQVVDVLNGSNAKSGGQRNGRFTEVTREANGRVRMRFSAESGNSYLIEASTNMVDWERIGVAQPLPNGGFEFAETPRGTFEQRFYRIVTPGHSP